MKHILALVLQIVTIVILLLFIRATRNLVTDLITRIPEMILGSGKYKQAMSVLGEKSGESRQVTAIQGHMAKGMVDKIIAPYKIPLTAIGIDLDALREKYGDMEILQAAQTFLPMVGIDPKELMAKGLKGVGSTVSQGVKQHW